MTRGVAYLNKTGPVPGQLEYNFFAHQVVFHSDDHDAWRKWSERLREHLVETQSTKGHTKGSWHFQGGDTPSKWGGRVYCTAMSVATLEIYYRHLPVFRARGTDPLGAE